MRAKGVARVDALAQHLTLHSEIEHRTSYLDWGDSFDDGLIADFVDCVRSGRAPSISGEDGLRATEVALAAYESARTGAPVRLPLHSS
jgi:predicted dehydrogenase